MSQDSTAPDGAWAVAWLLAGAPVDDIDAGALPDPWASVIQAIAQASGSERLAAFEALLSRLSGEQAAEMRTQVGRIGRTILQGRTEAAPKILPEVAGSAIPRLPQAALLTPELEAQAAGVGQWLDAYVSFASDVSPLTPPELHQSAGLWLGSVAIDPVNFEKPYTYNLEAVSTVYNSTPPDRMREARLTQGYPAITAKAVNTEAPATTYANWFSYATADFISENREIYRAIRTTRAPYPDQKLRFVADSGLDDRKVFRWIDLVQAEFVIRASHLERLVEVYNPRIERWELEPLQDLTEIVPWQATLDVTFSHAGRTREANPIAGWFLVRLPDSHQRIWVLVAEDRAIDRTTVLLTNVPLTDSEQVQAVYED